MVIVFFSLLFLFFIAVPRKYKITEIFNRESYLYLISQYSIALHIIKNVSNIFKLSNIC